MDPRVAEQAKILVSYSCAVKPGDVVLVLAPTTALPLITEIAAEVAKAGGQVVVNMADSRINRAFMLNATERNLSALPEPLFALMRDADVLVSIIAPENTKELSDVPSAKMGMLTKANGPVNQIVMRKERWNVTLHPTPALAQEAGRSIEAYSDFVYGAMLRDWPAAGEAMRVLSDRMASTKRVRIVGTETDISFSIEGRKPLVDAGKKNLPGGEVYTSPVEESVSGEVYFDLPFLFLARPISGVRLKFVEGRVVAHSAEVGNELLTEMLSVDDGAKRLGELGIGMNRGITEATKNTLFDEKMGDTFHMAVGRAFEEAGGKNQSSIHIDMIKSIKHGGTIYFDDSPVYEDGKFVWE